MLNMHKDTLFTIFVINYKTGEYETQLSALSLATSAMVSFDENFMLYVNTHHRSSKVHPCTGTEALYRPYGPQGE
jgi:hypothetical protein